MNLVLFSPRKLTIQQHITKVIPSNVRASRHVATVNCPIRFWRFHGCTLTTTYKYCRRRVHVLYIHKRGKRHLDTLRIRRGFCINMGQIVCSNYPQFYGKQSAEFARRKLPRTIRGCRCTGFRITVLLFRIIHNAAIYSFCLQPALSLKRIEDN